MLLSANNNMPMTIINTAVPFPLRTIVLSIKQSSPINKAGTIVCSVRLTAGTSTTSQLVMIDRSKVSIKQIA